MDGNARSVGQALRIFRVNANMDWDKEKVLGKKKRRIVSRLADVNVRLMDAGYKRLVEDSKMLGMVFKDKLRFVLRSLSDKDARWMLMAYNGLKQRALMLTGVGMGDGQVKKIQLIKRLTNQGYNLQVMAINTLREFLAAKRLDDKEKKGILRRILDSNVRMMGLTFRQSLQWTHSEIEAERKMFARQRGIAKRIVDVNTKLLGMGFNKLVEEWRGSQARLKEKLRFVIASLSDKDKYHMLMGYNGLTQRASMLNGVGIGNGGMMKIQLVRRLTNQGYNLQIMAVNKLKKWLATERLTGKDKDRVLRRVLDSNVRAMGKAFRQSMKWMQQDQAREINL
jgi:Pyruvate/2-oxoacid:ferredoxin oxidoreductase gamma subunit